MTQVFGPSPMSWGTTRCSLIHPREGSLGDVNGEPWGWIKEHLMAFLYRLHYTLHIPSFAGRNHWGDWFMGGIAIIWLLDCFIALAI